MILPSFLLRMIYTLHNRLLTSLGSVGFVGSGGVLLCFTDETVLSIKVKSTMCLKTMLNVLFGVARSQTFGNLVPVTAPVDIKHKTNLPNHWAKPLRSEYQTVGK
jgi:hypothetical protein